MLDINMFREDKGGDPEVIRKSQKMRGKPVEIVDEIIALDQQWIKKSYDASQKSTEINKLQKEIKEKKKNKEPCDDLLAKKVEMEKEKVKLKEEADQLEQDVRKKLITVGNICHESVIPGIDEANNEMVRNFPEGEMKKQEPEKGFLHHSYVLEMLDGYDPERGSAVAGHRGYFLKNEGVLLNQALVNYGQAFLYKKGYTPLQTPFFMQKDIMAETAQLSQFDEELYKVSGEGSEKYLIATSEQPISAFHRHEWIAEKSLPLKYGGYSTCFRKEAGSGGKDNWGVFRVHQFEKVEQFVLTEPEKSWEMFDEMIKVSEEFYQSLGIPYRIVGIVGGELNNAAAKKYDLEAWFPASGKYRELVSCSNCTDYQSRRLEIRCGIKKMGQTTKKYVHCLNSTLCATERAMCCILENYQTEEGLKIPEVLRPYMHGIEFVKFKKQLKDIKKGKESRLD